MTENKNDAITQDRINSAVLAACDTFRVVDATRYKDHILVMLFWKYISDVWNDHREQYEREFRDPKKVENLLQNERFLLPVDATFQSLYELRDADNIGELINIALDALEERNPEKLDGVFRNIDFTSEANLGQTRERNRLLRHLFEGFNKPELDLRPSHVKADLIGEAYMSLISRFASASGKKAGGSSTPRSVSTLLAKLADPKPGDRIFDPVCGSGSLLVEVGRETGGRNYALCGQEANGATWALARINMLLHDNDRAQIHWGNTLTAPTLLDEDGHLQRFDVVVASPPFSLGKWGAEEAASDPHRRFWRGLPPKSNGDYAFITHMIEVARRGSGRVAVVVPHGVLFRGGAEGHIRAALIEENLLDAVIGLPPNLFATTGIPVAILIFDRSRERGAVNEDRTDVVFIDASREYTMAKGQNLLEEAQIDRIVDAYRTRAEQDRFAHVVSRAEISKNEYSLSIPRYVDTFAPEPEIDIAAVQREIDEVDAELAEVRIQMAGYLKELGIDGR